jgi:hypothetical protein
VQRYKKNQYDICEAFFVLLILPDSNSSTSPQSVPEELIAGLKNGISQILAIENFIAAPDGCE